MGKRTFTPATDIPSLTGKVILVTGSNAGIGKATIRALAQHDPARIYLCARRRSAAETAAAELKNGTQYDRIDILTFDLASLDSVKKCAAEFNDRASRLDLLFLNAGVASTPPALTQDGYELQFGVNYLGHMLQTWRDNANVDVPIIAAASDAAFAPFLPKKRGLVLDEMRRPDAYGPMSLYAHSKLANVLFIRKLAQLYPGISAFAAHPGVVATEIWDKSAGGLMSALFKPIVWATAVDSDGGAKSQLWCATTQIGSGVEVAESGQYYQPVGKNKALKGLSADQKVVDELWEWTNNELASYNSTGWPV
ncbi:uncharacterized protein BJX67DRAFT_379408 [Aspergillus lucknowensis]|uniref:NAD(P)-binding protein n=1 Tax=Aspergillus lucknowensis TaxID=176173 RepID=A0ABR4LXY0_9EURO